MNNICNILLHGKLILSFISLLRYNGRKLETQNVIFFLSGSSPETEITSLLKDNILTSNEFHDSISCVNRSVVPPTYYYFIAHTSPNASGRNYFASNVALLQFLKAALFLRFASLIIISLVS